MYSKFAASPLFDLSTAAQANGNSPGSSSRCGGDGDDPDTIQIIAENIDILLERHPSIIIVLESMVNSPTLDHQGIY